VRTSKRLQRIQWRDGWGTTEEREKNIPLFSACSRKHVAHELEMHLPPGLSVQPGTRKYVVSYPEFTVSGV
jgi:hypothetical protein